MSFTDHRKKVLEAMEDQSLAIVYAGQETHANEDQYLHFVVNSQFYWLTGLDRAGMILLMSKMNGVCESVLFIDPFDPHTERWTGKMPTKEQVIPISGIENVRYTNEFNSALNRILSHNDIQHVYFDTYKYSASDLPTWNEAKAADFLKNYPAIRMHDLHAVAAKFRVVKDEEEIEMIRQAIGITKKGVDYILEELHPGKYEYQVSADFEYRCRYEGMKDLAFTTIAGSNINGCMMHYMENSRKMEDGDLILLDLGAAYKHYCSDVSRTFPVNGKFSPRQREIYELVLKANKAIAAAAKPGVVLKDLNKVAQEVLAEGLTKIGLLKEGEDVMKYLIHGVGHSLGADIHDINMDPQAVLQPGWVITDEPGLYIDDEAIGIRIEDDLLITEDGSEYLTGDIPKEVEEIEAYMAAHNRHLKG